MAEIDVTVSSAAAPEAVWALLADVSTWSSWSGFDESHLDKPAPSGDPNGVGARRRFRFKRTKSLEEVVGFDAPRSLSYTLLEGLPVRNYRSTVTLTPANGGGTSINWHSSFERSGGIPTWLIAPRLQRFITQTATQLATAAARAA